MKRYTSFLAFTCAIFLLLFALFSTSSAKRWSPEDESRRISELKKEEKRLFEKEMGQPLISQESEENPSFDYGAEKRWQQSLQPSSLPYSSVPNRRPRPAPQPITQEPVVLNTSANWCFQCASPWSAISSEMRQVVRNLLEVRRSTYPNQTVVSSFCTNPRDKLDLLMRQPCLYSYCQTIILTDHETGSAFTLRGCAESFGAIDPAILSNREDNTCKRLHDDIDIQECICKDRKYCYTGPERRIHYTENLRKFNIPLMQKQLRHGNSAPNLSEQKLHQLGITHAIDSTNIPKTLRLPTIEYLTVAVDDSTTAPLEEYFDASIELIRKAKDTGGKALVYCAAGVSRSASLCIVGLMAIEGLTLREAYMEVVAQRPIIAPNHGFWRQMIAFEKKINGSEKATVQLLKGMRTPVPDVYLHKSSILASTSTKE
ncbi:dual specificity phosphatase, catalytic domain-containing protein [Ditylenchus destructor]|uniref:Dual specificity phosphatase, catalytic domain-containing protein n=1 Tax=Ditylenchus destructor TaxID=166010 RepID=A0AAD4N5M1_9BILA|nr:dual specificity phosphatase, catalytic domain-containing protein [Ditylenchus destructor]